MKGFFIPKMTSYDDEYDPDLHREVRMDELHNFRCSSRHDRSKVLLDYQADRMLFDGFLLGIKVNPEDISYSGIGYEIWKRLRDLYQEEKIDTPKLKELAAMMMSIVRLYPTREDVVKSTGMSVDDFVKKFMESSGYSE